MTLIVNEILQGNCVFAADARSLMLPSIKVLICFHCYDCLQLYKTREEKYLLDLQRVNGPQFLFLDLCAAFLAQLRVL